MFFYVINSRNGYISLKYKTQKIDQALEYIEQMVSNWTQKISYMDKMNHRLKKEREKYDPEIVLRWCEFRDWYFEASKSNPVCLEDNFTSWLVSKGISPLKWNSMYFSYSRNNFGKTVGAYFESFDSATHEKNVWQIVEDIKESPDIRLPNSPRWVEGKTKEEIEEATKRFMERAKK